MDVRIFLKKLSGMFLTVLLITLLTFFGFELVKSDAALVTLGVEASPEQVNELREKLGLNEPIVTRYLKYVGRIAKGNFGESFIYKAQVSNIVTEKLIITSTMAVIAMFIVIIFSLIISVVSTLVKDNVIEKILIVINQIVMSVPAFFSGMIITLVCGFIFKIFIPGKFISYKENFTEFVKYMIFPSIAIAMPKCAMTIRLLTSNIRAEYNSSYVKTAVSRGNSRIRVLLSHVLKNSVLPIITFLGMSITDILAAGIVVEQVFDIPGISRLLVGGISNRDYPLVQGIILVIAIIIVSVNILVDFAYSLLDPRLKVK